MLTSNLSSQVHDDKEKSLDEEQLMLEDPSQGHVFTEELDTDTPTQQHRDIHSNTERYKAIHRATQQHIECLLMFCHVLFQDDPTVMLSCRNTAVYFDRP